MTTSSRTLSEKLFKPKLGFYIGLAGNIIFLILVSISHLFAISNGYDWQYWELSELVLYGSTAEIFFLIGSIVNGCCLVFALVPMASYFREKKAKITYLILALSTAFLLILVGAITERLWPSIHYVVGAGFLVITGILVLYTSVYIIIKIKQMSIFYPIFGFFVFGLMVFHLATRWLFGMAYTQRLAIVFSMAYLLMIGGKLLLSDENELLTHNNLIKEENERKIEMNDD